MRQHRPAQAASNLHDDEDQGAMGGDLAADGKGQRHRGVEMRPGYRPENRDQDIEDGARRDGIAKQRHRVIAAGQPLGHDPRPDDGGQQHHRANAFGDQLAGCRWHAHGNSPARLVQVIFFVS